jgi:hypothetical protein
MGKIARALCLVVPVTLAAPAVLGSSSAAAAEEEDQEAQRAADVKIEIRQEDGKVVTYRGELLSYGIDFKLEFEGEGHAHEVTLNIQEGTSKKLKVKLAYDRDANPIIAPYVVDFEPKKREVLWADDIAMALTFKPKKIKPKDTTRDEDEQFKPEENDDPLGDLKLKDDEKKKKKEKKK